MIEFGVESFSDRILKNINKRADVKTQIQTLHMAYNAGIKLGINLIVGFPQENDDSLQETLSAVRHKIPPVQTYCLERLKLCPGSPIYEKEVEAGRFKEESWFLSKEVWQEYKLTEYSSRMCEKYGQLIRKHLGANSGG